MYANHWNFHVLQEIEVQEHDGDVKPEVEIQPFRACTMKDMQYNLIYVRIAEISLY